MGFTQVSWDNESGKEPQPASSSKSWADLTAVEKSAAAVLGYSQPSWDDPWPAVPENRFAELTAAQQAAAGALGYDATSWDNESGNEQQPAAGSKGWAELSVKEKAASTVLGYTQLTWDTDPPETPASASKEFANLQTTCGENAVALPQFSTSFLTPDFAFWWIVSLLSFPKPFTGSERSQYQCLG